MRPSYKMLTFYVDLQLFAGSTPYRVLRLADEGAAQMSSDVVDDQALLVHFDPGRTVRHQFFSLQIIITISTTYANVISFHVYVPL